MKKNKKIFIIIIIILTLILLFGNKSYKTTVKQYVTATMQGNGKKVVDLMPKQYIELAIVQGSYNRQEDGSPLKPDSMTQKWRRFLEAHDLPKIRLHDLRHSNATALIRAGVNPRVVQQRLGHSDVNITLNTYTHVLPEMDMEAAAKLDSILLKRA